MNGMNNFYMLDMRMDEPSYDYSQAGGNSTSTTMTSSQTLSVPAFSPCTTSPASIDSSFLAGMMVTRGSPLLSVASAGDSSPLAEYGLNGTDQMSGSIRTSYTGSNFGDFLDVGAGTTIATHAGGIPTPTSTQAFALFDSVSWHSGANDAGTDGIYGSYRSDAGSGAAADLSPLSNLYTRHQPLWPAPTSASGDEDLHRSYSLSPHSAYHSGELDQGSTSPAGASDALYFSGDTDMSMNWSSVPSMTDSLQLPPLMKDGKKSRLSSKLASTKLPQVVTSNYHDSSVDLMSSSHAGSISLSTTSASGHGQGLSFRRSSSNVSSGTGDESRKTKSHHSGRSGSGGAGTGSSGSVCKKEFTCTHVFCNSPVFTRMADLDRHIKHIHMDADKKEQFLCDYTACSRSTTPFHRKDHYREHLREYHLEDLLKRGSNAHRSTSPNTASGSTASDYKKNKKLMQEMQLKNCKTDPSWWRCARCLKRVSISGGDWTCPTCKGSIEDPRKSLRLMRGAMSGTDMDVAMQPAAAVPGWPYGNTAYE